MPIGSLPEESYADAVALWHTAKLTRPWNDPSADLRRAMTGTASTVLAALDEQAGLLGTAMVGHDGHRGWVYYLAVRPDRQRRGIGRQLMVACENWVRERGIAKIQLMVRHSNPAVIEFYTALGYTDSEVVVLARPLDPSPPRGELPRRARP